jgi:predicted lipoprotein with Yx(FWY)xxD motif
MNSPLPARTITCSFAAVAVASVFLAACGSSSKASTAPPAAAGSTATNASVTLSVATLPGLGPVLVNGDGFTLYILPQEKGGKVTCTATGGCTKYWPAAVLPTGMSQGIAGTGVQASLLGTVKSPSGETRLTYAGWPLYTYVGDSAPGKATGQGFKDSFGVWWALDPSGNALITPAATAPTTAGNGGGTATTTPTSPTSPSSVDNGGGSTTTVPTGGGGVSY